MDYGTLKTTVEAYLNRSDLSSYIPTFITLGASRIHYGGDNPYSSAPLRIPAMQTRATGTTTGTISIPTGFLEVIRLKCSNGSTYWNIDYASPSQFSTYENSSDYPSYYTFINNTIETTPTASASYTLDYYKAFDAFSADVDTNWLLTNVPDAYLFAALTESAPFIDDEKTVGWFGMYRSIVSSLNRSPGIGGGSLQIKAG